MSVFKDYSSYYNLLYKDKDYKAETDYVVKHIQAHNKTAKSLLNLGCGTGNHDFIFAQAGLHVTGVDMSEDMVRIANERKAAEKNTSVDFVVGDIRTFRINKQFDSVVSLFHVMSYQTSNSDLENAINTAHQHLKEDGVFIFDCWYGPGVLTDRPTVRNREFENEKYKVKRLSTPHMYANDNCVDVEFNVEILDKTNGTNYNIHEVHKMRYLFLPEVIYFLNKNGFKLMHSEEWLSGKPLTYNSWNAVFICKKG